MLLPGVIESLATVRDNHGGEVITVGVTICGSDIGLTELEWVVLLELCLLVERPRVVLVGNPLLPRGLHHLITFAKPIHLSLSLSIYFYN